MKMNAYNVNETTLHDEIRKLGVTLVDFGAPWCPPCKTLLPMLDELEQEYEGKLSVLKINCDESPMAVSQYGIMSMPTVVIFHNGEPVERMVGLRPKNVYRSAISRYIQ